MLFVVANVHTEINSPFLLNSNPSRLQVYRIVSTCLGIPPKTFVCELYDKDKKYVKLGPMTPLEFYTEHVKPLFNVDDQVSVLYLCYGRSKACD